MSTRSRIGIQNTLGEIASIYCHHDGYVAVWRNLDMNIGINVTQSSKGWIKSG